MNTQSNSHQAAAASRKLLRRQSLVSWLLAPLWIPLLSLLMHWGMGWRFRDLKAARAQYQTIRGNGPLLICANHLTMADSAIIAYALASPVWLLRHWFAFPWNVPEWENFAFSRASRLLAWLAKCVPIRRGGSADSVADSLSRLTCLLEDGETLLIFPEAGRSRSGRISFDSPADGVGKLLQRVPKTRVLCVYARGDKQLSWGNLPQRGDHFTVAMQEISPQSSRGGLRGIREKTMQILQQLESMETSYFNDLAIHQEHASAGGTKP